MILYQATSIPKDDLFDLNENGDRWLKIKENYERIVKYIF